MESNVTSWSRRAVEDLVINDKKRLTQACCSLREKGEKIVLMTGCFDLLHAGHLDGICDASEYGSLVMGINSDAFVKRLKGENRPIRNQDERAYLMAGFAPVEFVTIFDDDCELMRAVRPHFYIASITSHEKVWDIPEQINLLNEMGTEIITFGPEKRNSTTGIIKLILNLNLNIEI